MNKSNKLNKRHNFEKIKTGIELPDLLDLQVGSFHDFLQEDVDPNKENCLDYTKRLYLSFRSR